MTCLFESIFFLSLSLSLSTSLLPPLSLSTSLLPPLSLSTSLLPPLSLQHTVEKTIFLNHFYRHSMHRLMAPLMAQSAGDKISKGCPLRSYKSLTVSPLLSLSSSLSLLFSLSLDTGSNAVLLSHILDLLSVCVEKHSYYIRKYTIDRNLLGRVLVLMTSAHRHLTLGLFSLLLFLLFFLLLLLSLFHVSIFFIIIIFF